MKMRKPLTDEDGEVRELLIEDIRRFRPMAEGISATLAAKLGSKSTPMPRRRRQKSENPEFLPATPVNIS
jgi:hypothetical protein